MQTSMHHRSWRRAVVVAIALAVGALAGIAPAQATSTAAPRKAAPTSWAPKRVTVTPAFTHDLPVGPTTYGP
jgi:curli biogenesis system outer membrane secretion channel CsgG